jgi:HSP20 family protein
MTESRNPFRELQRLLEQMQENFEQGGRWWESASGEDGGTASVRVDLEDRDAELLLTADLPGFEKDDIDLRVTDHTLHLEAEHEDTTEETGGEYVRRERRRAAVARSVPLPEAVEVDDIAATYENGVLTVRMPKSEPATAGTHIEVN